MSYTRTQAKSGKGFALALNTGTGSTPTWTPILEQAKIAPAMKWDKDDATNFNSAGKENILTMFDGGDWKVEGNLVVSDAGQSAMYTAFLAGTLQQFQATAPLSGSQASVGDAFAFYANIQEWNPEWDPTKKVPIKFTLAVSNGVVRTAGS